MKFNSTTEYAIRILIYMSKDAKALFHTKQISEDLDISYKYMSKIITMLVKGNLIVSKKGKHGGIILNRNPNEITLKDILKVMKDYDVSRCILGLGKCNEREKCALHESWGESKNTINKTFLQKSLAQLAHEA